jgi:hypothetical protein
MASCETGGGRIAKLCPNNNFARVLDGILELRASGMDAQKPSGRVGRMRERPRIYFRCHTYFP